MYLIKTFISISLFSFMIQICAAQVKNQVTEESVALEKEFINAHQQKLLGRLDKALPLFEALHKKNRENAAVPYEIARIYKEQKDIELAKRYINRAIENDQTNKWYLIFLAELQDEQSQFLEAAKTYERLHTLDPKDESYLHELSVAYANGGAYKQSLQILEKWEQMVGIQESIIRRKIDVYLLLDNKKAPIKELNKLIKTYPDDLRYQNNLGAFYAQIGNRKQAKKIYQTVLKVDEQNATASAALLGLSTNATAQGDNALTQLINNPNASIDQKIAALVKPTLAVDKPDPSLEAALQQLLDGHQGDPKATAIFADYYMNTKQFDQAIAQYQATLKGNKNIFPVWDQLMTALDATEDFGTLATTSTQAIDYFPNQASAYYYNGKAKLMAGDNAAAIDMLQEASLIAGKNELLKYKSYTYLAKANMDIADKDQAAKYLAKAKKINDRSNPILDQVKSQLDKS